MPTHKGRADAIVNRGDGGRQSPERERESAKSGLARRVMVDALLAIAVVVAAVGGVILLVQGDNGQNPPPGRGGNIPYATPPAYEVFWKANAPGMFTAEQAFATEMPAVQWRAGEMPAVQWRAGEMPARGNRRGRYRLLGG